jgi:L-proline amide hydrolase
VHLLGHSAGGWSALQYALCRPHGMESLHLASTCASLPQYETGVRRLERELPDRADIALFNRRHLTGTDVVPAHVERALMSRNRTINAVMVGALEGWDVTNQLGGIDAPVLVTSGRDDTMTPDTVRSMVEAIPGARWVILRICRWSPRRSCSCRRPGSFWTGLINWRASCIRPLGWLQSADGW